METNQPKVPKGLWIVGLLAAAVGALALFGPFQQADARDLFTQPDQRRPVQQQRPTIEVAFVLDTTGSMGGLLEGAKQKVWSIANEIAKGQPTPRLKVALVGYRDIGDEYVTKKFDLTEDLDTVFANLRQFQAGGGGDWPEHVGQALGETVSQLSWSQDRRTMKMIFVVGDAPPQQYQDGWDYRTWAKRAVEKGITVNTVRCGTASDTEVAWREMSRLADGTYASIDQSGGMIAVRTPYDEELARINSEIATKTIYGGESGARTRAARKAEAVARMDAPAAADRMGYAAKSGGGAPAAAAPAAEAGAFDLLAEPSRLASVDDGSLPSDLRGMDKEARVAHVGKLAKEREVLAGKAAKLAKDRDEWISKNAAPKADSFDAKVMSEVKKKAEKYGVTY